MPRPTPGIGTRRGRQVASGRGCERDRTGGGVVRRRPHRRASSGPPRGWTTWTPRASGPTSPTRRSTSPRPWPTPTAGTPRRSSAPSSRCSGPGWPTPPWPGPPRRTCGARAWSPGGRRGWTRTPSCSGSCSPPMPDTTRPWPRSTTTTPWPWPTWWPRWTWSRPATSWRPSPGCAPACWPDCGAATTTVAASPPAASPALHPAPGRGSRPIPHAAWRSSWPSWTTWWGWRRSRTGSTWWPTSCGSSSCAPSGACPPSRPPTTWSSPATRARARPPWPACWRRSSAAWAWWSAASSSRSTARRWSRATWGRPPAG